MSFQHLLNAHIDGLDAYSPIQPLEVLSERLGIAVGNLVKLDANETRCPDLDFAAWKRMLAEYDAKKKEILAEM